MYLAACHWQGVTPVCPLENDDGGELGNGDQEANVGIFPKGGGLPNVMLWCYGVLLYRGATNVRKLLLIYLYLEIKVVYSSGKNLYFHKSLAIISSDKNPKRASGRDETKMDTQYFTFRLRSFGESFGMTIHEKWWCCWLTALVLTRIQKWTKGFFRPDSGSMLSECLLIPESRYFLDDDLFYDSNRKIIKRVTSVFLLDQIFLGFII